VRPKFWDKVASENFTWQEWDKVVDFNMAETDIKWFTNAKVKKLYHRQTSCKGDKNYHFEQMIQMKIAYFV
jgi:acetyl-CoA synthetase